MHWILIHWELVLPLAAAAIVMLFDVVLKMRQEEAVPLRAYLAVVLLLMAGISLTMIAQDRPEIPHLAAHLKLDYSGGNGYVEDLIDSSLGDLQGHLQKSGFETQSLRETLGEIVRATDRTKKDDQVSAIDYCIRWAGDFSDYLRANQNAVRRGVFIHRVFVIPTQIANDPKAAKACWAEMVSQKALGIDVKFAKESDLNRFAHYHEYNNDKGMVDFHLGTNSVLMFEAVRYWEAMERGEPPKLMVTWQPSDIQREENYFRWLVSPSPAGAGVVHEVDPKKPQPF